MSIAQATRALTRAAKAQFPGASDADVRQFVLLQVNTALDSPSRTTKDEDVLKLADAAFDEAATLGESWAVALKNSFRDSVVKPLVEEARSKGVDPVPVVVFKTNLSEDEARSMIEALDADGADSSESGDSDTEDQAGTDDGDATSFPASVTAQY